MTKQKVKKSEKNQKTPFEILILNGVNLDLLGTREPHIYGDKNLEDLESFLQSKIKEEGLNQKILLSFLQTNQEAEFLDALSNKKYDAVIMNPGAWSHTSLAIADRCAGVSKVIIEVHLSHVFGREEIRTKMVTASKVRALISGLGFFGYYVALLSVLDLLKASEASQKL